MNNNNFWRRVDAGDVSNNPYFKVESVSDKGSQDTTPTGEDKQNTANSTPNIINGQYSFIEGDTYAKGVHKLQDTLKSTLNAHPMFVKDQRSNIYRPLTFRENIEARIDDFETKIDADGNNRSDDERAKLFNNYLDSCTGIAYKANSTKFKIKPICEELILINKGFNDGFKPITYNNFQGVELDSALDKYDSLLTKSQFLNHQGYNLLFDTDKKLMSNYWDIVRSLKDSDNLMSFWIRTDHTEDELRALYVRNIVNNSIANGSSDLYDVARFLLVAPKKNFQVK